MWRARLVHNMWIFPMILILALCLDDGAAHRISNGDQVHTLEAHGHRQEVYIQSNMLQGEDRRFRPRSVRVSQKRSAKWTKGVDDRIDSLQNELATAQARAHSAKRTMQRLGAKRDAELAHAKAERIHDPKAGGLTDEDINREYGKLMSAEKEDLEHQEVVIKTTSASLEKLGEARKKIVKAAVGVVAIDQVARMKANQHKHEAKELHAAMKKAAAQDAKRYQSMEARAAWNKQSAAYDKEHAAAKTKAANLAEEEVAKEVTDVGPAGADTEAGIIERIEMASDGAISRQTAKSSGFSSKNIAKWNLARKLVRKRLRRLRQSSKNEVYFNATHLSETNKILQEKANAEATLKLTQKMAATKDKADPLPSYETEYHAFKMTNTPEHNVTAAADMAEITERTVNLKQWIKEHEEHEDQLVKDQLARLADAENKNAELNRISLQANELNQKKKALQHLAKLKVETKKIKDAQKAQDQKDPEGALPAIPEDYATAHTADGKEDISKSQVVASLNSKINHAQQEFATASSSAESHTPPDVTPSKSSAPQVLHSQIKAVNDGIKSIDKASPSNK